MKFQQLQIVQIHQKNRDTLIEQSVILMQQSLSYSNIAVTKRENTKQLDESEAIQG